MKTHIQEVYLELDLVGKLTVRDSSINMLVKLTAYQEHLTKGLGNILSNIMQESLASMLESLCADKENTSLSAQDNAVKGDRTLLNTIDAYEMCLYCKENIYHLLLQ